MSDKKGLSGFDADLVRDLAQILAEQGLTEIEIEHGEVRLRLARTPAAAAPVQHFAAPPQAPPPAAPAEAPAAIAVVAAPAAEDWRSDARTVKSPMVGTAYLAPEPGAAPFVRVGDQVSAGQTLLVVEAMKTFNPIPAHRAGRVLKILVTDNQPVEFGEPLFVIE